MARRTLLDRALGSVGLIRQSVKAVVAALPEILTGLAFVGGWTLVTVGLAALLSPVVWLFSLGLLAISLGGWRLFYIFIRDGLYVLLKAGKRG